MKRKKVLVNKQVKMLIEILDIPNYNVFSIFLLLCVLRLRIFTLLSFFTNIYT